MSSSVFAAISNHHVEVFRTSFCSVARDVFYDEQNGRLRHAAEFGAYRERICADYLKLFLPTYLKVGTGFLINRDDGVSTQCDLTIFDPEYTPLVVDAEHRRFFPVETVVGIGEIKSVLTKTEFFAALIKLAAAKALRDSSSKHAVRRSSYLSDNPQDEHHYNEMVSFVICEKFSFNVKELTSEISAHYDSCNVHPRHRHNLILSIQDGLFCYKNPLINRDVVWMYPFTRGEVMKNRLVYPGANAQNHFGIFNAYLFMLFANSTVFLPHIADYDQPQVMGLFETEA